MQVHPDQPLHGGVGGPRHHLGAAAGVHPAQAVGEGGDGLQVGRGDDAMTRPRLDRGERRVQPTGECAEGLPPAAQRTRARVAARKGAVGPRQSAQQHERLRGQRARHLEVARTHGAQHAQPLHKLGPVLARGELDHDRRVRGAHQERVAGEPGRRTSQPVDLHAVGCQRGPKLAGEGAPTGQAPTLRYSLSLRTAIKGLRIAAEATDRARVRMSTE
jgi:hypothetical protein